MARSPAVSFWRSTTSAVTALVSASTRPFTSRIRPRSAGTCTISSELAWAATARLSPPATWRNHSRVRSPAKSATTTSPMMTSRPLVSTSALTSSTRCSPREVFRPPPRRTIVVHAARGTRAREPSPSDSPGCFVLAVTRRPSHEREHDGRDQGVVERGDGHRLQAREREEPALRRPRRRSRGTPGRRRSRRSRRARGAIAGGLRTMPAWNTPTAYAVIAYDSAESPSGVVRNRSIASPITKPNQRARLRAVVVRDREHRDQPDVGRDAVDTEVREQRGLQHDADDHDEPEPNAADHGIAGGR